MRIAKWKTFSKEEIEAIVADSFSEAEVARKLGYQHGGSALKKMYEEYNLDTSHFKGAGWNKGNYDYDSFKPGCHKSKGQTMRKALVNLRGAKCECCGLTEWMGKPINLEVHHVDGDRSNNSLDNLQLLCPNCHSYTPNFRHIGAGQPYRTDEEFVIALRGAVSIRQALLQLGLTPRGANYDRAWRLVTEYDIDHLRKKSNK